MKGACHCGAARWRLDAVPESATACNCTVCRRYGALWAYGHEGEDIHVTGPATAYAPGAGIDFCFCPACGCVLFWRGRRPETDGRTRIAVNLRLAEPDEVAAIPLEHFDGLVTFDDLGQDGRCVKDMWF